MPLEGHWQRTHTPVRQLDPRQLWLVRIVGSIVAVSLVIAVVLIAWPHTDAPPAAGCIDAQVPGIMGGGHVDPCGQKAISLCRSQVGRTDSYATPILASCRTQGILPR